MARALIALGANLGDRIATLEAASRRLAAQPAIHAVHASRWHETAPVGGPAGQQPFLNAAAVCETSLAPGVLHALLHEIESELGRERRIRWDARALDLDLLLYDELTIDTPQLAVPHPRMAFRRFVLAPAAEVAADMRHPASGMTVGELLENLDRRPQYVAVAGPIASGKTRLVLDAAAQTGSRSLLEPVDEAQLTSFYADPHGTADAFERSLHLARTQQLTRAVEQAGETALVSDYWLDQSLAYAAVWLDAGRQPAFLHEWEQIAAEAHRPSLLVVLDAPSDWLAAHVAARGRPYEAALSAERLAALRDSLLTTVGERATGPILRLDARNRDNSLTELTAAIEAMR